MTDNIFDFGDVDPIDIVESLAEHYKWDFDRIAQDQITMLIEGGWRTYSLSLAWCEFDETLKFICSFDLKPPERRHSNLYEILEPLLDDLNTPGYIAKLHQLYSKAVKGNDLDKKIFNQAHNTLYNYAF